VNPILNILTRTYKRPVSFADCRTSILSQTYANINHIVGSPISCSYYPDAMIFETPKTTKRSVNLYMHELAKTIKDGWVMYLDDDDKFMSETSAAEIMSEIEHDNQLLLWRVKIGKIIVPADQYFGRTIKQGHISGIGFAFHSKHLPAPWDAGHASDHRVIKHFADFLEVKWIDKILTRTQGSRNHKGAIPKKDLPKKKKT